MKGFLPFHHFCCKKKKYLEQFRFLFNQTHSHLSPHEKGRKNL
jgi:hypothetical protein